MAKRKPTGFQICAPHMPGQTIAGRSVEGLINSLSAEAELCGHRAAHGGGADAGSLKIWAEAMREAAIVLRVLAPMTLDVAAGEMDRAGLVRRYRAQQRRNDRAFREATMAFFAKRAAASLQPAAAAQAT